MIIDKNLRKRLDKYLDVSAFLYESFIKLINSETQSMGPCLS